MSFGVHDAIMELVDIIPLLPDLALKGNQCTCSIVVGGTECDAEFVGGIPLPPELALKGSQSHLFHCWGNPSLKPEIQT